MDDLAAFNVGEVKRAATEERESERERETSTALQKDSESRNKRQSHPNELSENKEREMLITEDERRKRDGR